MGEERYLIDEQGYLIDVVISDENSANLISVKIEDVFHKPKWNGDKWVEGLSDIEIADIRNNNKAITNELSELDKIRLAQAEQFEFILRQMEGMM